MPEKVHSPLAAAADQHIKKAGAQAIAMVGDKSEAWVQTSSTKHPWHDMHQQHALLRLKAMDELGLYLDREQCAIYTVKMRTVRRTHDAFDCRAPRGFDRLRLSDSGLLGQQILDIKCSDV